jgi:hypothetical protein
MQTPLLQNPSHALPQAPQFALSDERRTHVPEQSVYPGAHVGGSHTPPLQMALEHRCPHHPQLFGSFARSRHTDPQ